MARKIASRKVLLALVTACIVGVTSLAALAVQTDVSLVTVSGSRTLTVKSLTGGALTSMSLGSDRSAGFAVNVTDVAYDRKNYQVTAMMSNLYQFDGTNYTCSASVGSGKLSIGFLASPSSVLGVAAAAQPVLNFAGSITGALAVALGVANPTSIAVPVTEQLQSFTNSSTFTGAEAALPLQLATGSGGAFTNPAPHPTCNPSATGASSVQLQAGSVNSGAGVLAWMQAAQNSIYSTAASGGTLTAAQAVTAGMITQAGLDTAVRTVLTAAPLNAPSALAVPGAVLDATPSLISQVEALLTAPVPSVASILRQTGSYTSLPSLVVGDLSGIPTGTYKGTMTITLIES